MTDRPAEQTHNVPTTLELVTRGFGIETLSPVQMAICLALDGLSLEGLWDNPDVRAVFGNVRPVEGVAPLTVVLVAASRALKTKMCAAKMIQCLLACDIGVASPGDEIRLSVLGPDLDKAKPGFSNMLALANVLVRDQMIGEPLKQSFRVMRDRTRQLSIEATLAALVRGGGGLVARWCAGALFSEAPRMVGEDEGARNIDESLTALQNRMLPGSQIILEGSPWAPWGPVYELDEKHFGHPTADILVIRANGPRLWPARYTPEYCAKIEARDQRAYQADVLGRYVDPEDALIATVDVDICTTKGVVKREPRTDDDGKLLCDYIATMDPATRGNAWTLTVLGTIGENDNGSELYEQAVAAQWQGTQEKPLKPSVVLKEIKELCKPFGVDHATTDQASFDSLADIGESVGFGLAGLFGNDDDVKGDCGQVRAAISEHRIALLDHPQQKTDLQRVKLKVTSNDFTYSYPQSGNGRHCDFVPALGRALRFAPPARKKVPTGTNDALRQGPRVQGQASIARSLLR